MTIRNATVWSIAPVRSCQTSVQRANVERAQHADGRQEDAADAVAEQHDGGLVVHAALDEVHQLADARLAADRFDADTQRRADVHRAAEHLAAGFDANQVALAGEKGLIDVARTALDRAIGTEQFARPDFDDVVE
ncbi:MAG: hypothetical protein QM770_14940 [Tepidisphaeraceae bacterium]